jgi:hypothetical protein
MLAPRLSSTTGVAVGLAVAVGGVTVGDGLGVSAVAVWLGKAVALGVGVRVGGLRVTVTVGSYVGVFVGS